MRAGLVHSSMEVHQRQHEHCLNKANDRADLIAAKPKKSCHAYPNDAGDSPVAPSLFATLFFKRFDVSRR